VAERSFVVAGGNEEGRILEREPCVLGHRPGAGEVLLRAPMAGLIVARNFDAGSVVGPGNDKPVVAVADMRTLKLEAGVSELDAGRLKIGAAAKVTLSARPGETFD
jgi:multidrug resistance efflux pump